MPPAETGQADTGANEAATVSTVAAKRARKRTTN